MQKDQYCDFVVNELVSTIFFFKIKSNKQINVKGAKDNDYLTHANIPALCSITTRKIA